MRAGDGKVNAQRLRREKVRDKFSKSKKLPVGCPILSGGSGVIGLFVIVTTISTWRKETLMRSKEGRARPICRAARRRMTAGHSSSVSRQQGSAARVSVTWAQRAEMFVVRPSRYGYSWCSCVYLMLRPRTAAPEFCPRSIFPRQSAFTAPLRQF